MKKWHFSKTVWFNVFMTLVDSAAYFQDVELLGSDVLPFLISIQGIGNIILRVWFTSQPVGNVKLLSDYVEQESREPSSINAAALKTGAHPHNGSAFASEDEEFVEIARRDSNGGHSHAEEPVEGLIIENNTVGPFIKGSQGAVLITLKRNNVPVSGALVVADYYKSDNTSFLHNQSFSEIGSTGMYYHTFPISSDVSEGMYGAIIQATKKADGENFADDFTGIGGSIGNWRIISGSWGVQNNIYRQTREDFMNFSVISFPEALKWSDYSYEVDVRWDSNKNGQLGILGRWLDPTTFYSLYFDPSLEGGKVVLRRGDTVLQIADYPLEYPSAFIRLKMIFSGSTIRCYVDDVLKIELIDETPIKNGTIGLYTQHIAASFGNVNVLQQGRQIFTSTSINFEVK